MPRKMNFLVTLEIPSGANAGDAKAYILDAVQSMKGCRHPDDPMSNLDWKSVGVRGFGSIKGAPTAACQICFYADRDGPGVLCRRYGPTGSNVREDRAPDDKIWLAVWPHVRPTDWCGEFKHEEIPA